MDNPNFLAISNSGQCFRLNLVNQTAFGNTYTVISKDHFAYISQSNSTSDAFSISCSSEDDTGLEYWKHYFDMDTDYQPIYDKINASYDKFLKSALEYSKGMRILRQDFWEALVSFLISQNNNIPRIKQTIEELCTRFGKWLWTDNLLHDHYSFPTKEMLDKQVTRIDDLDGLGLGYRQKYLYALIKADSSEVVPEYDKLLKLQGVGPKVASCALLYGNHDMTQFPIDTWMKKLIDDVYGGHFDVEPYSEWAGFVQQIMFFYYRHLRGIK